MDDDPRFIERSIIVRGPCRSSAFYATQSYHRKRTMGDLNAKHEETRDELEKNPARLVKYWMIIFPERIKLDNVILSGDGRQIQRGKTGVTYQAGNIEAKDMFVSWDIAIKGVGHSLEQGTTTSLEDDFA